MLACQCVQAFGASPPKLVFEPAAPSFGAIRRALENDLALEVNVRNESETAFDLRQVQIGCGCMAVEVVSPGALKPGASGKLRITLDRHRVRTGLSSYALTVIGATGGPVASVPVTYDYDPAIYAEHTELFIDAEEPAGAEAATTVWVRRPDRGASAPRVECDSDYLEARLQPIPEPPTGRYRLNVACRSDAPAIGHLNATLAIYLPGSSKPDVSIPLHCRIEPPVSVRPAAVLLKSVRPGQELRRTLRLTSRKPFTVKSITTSSGELRVKEKQATDGKVQRGALAEQVYELVIRPQGGGGNDAAFEAEVRIDIDSPAVFQLVVPVVGELAED